MRAMLFGVPQLVQFGPGLADLGLQDAEIEVPLGPHHGHGAVVVKKIVDIGVGVIVPARGAGHLAHHRQEEGRIAVGLGRVHQQLPGHQAAA